MIDREAPSPVRVTDHEAIASRFAADGYVAIADFASPEAIAALRERAAEIVAACDPAEASIFTTRRDASSRDAFFLESGATIRCFFEEGAFDADGALRVPPALAINKIGHALHDLDPVFDRFSHDPRLAEIGRAVGLANPHVYQSMYIFKQPRIGGVVDWHQDATFFATAPQSVVTFWFALERADRGNGCLLVRRGGHRDPLREQFVVEDGVTRSLRLDASPWPVVEDAVAVEVDAGALVLMHGLLPHYSAPNRSAASRHAYTLHAVDAGARYDPRNWLQRTAALPVRGFVPG